MITRSLAMHGLAKLALLLVGLGAGLCMQASVARAERVAGLYQVEVAVEGRDAASVERAYREAMRIVLLRATGRDPASSDRRLQAIEDNAQRYVQQYGYTTRGMMRVGFDEELLRSALIEAAQPVWDADRPLTIVWLAVDEGGGQRAIVGADDNTTLANALRTRADRRGVPLVLPILDSEDLSGLRSSDIWGGFDEKILAASRRYAADAVLAGRGEQSPDGGLEVRWTLYLQGQEYHWQDDVASGIDRAADRLAAIYAPAGDQELRELRVAVSAIHNLDQYGRVSRFLESITRIQSVTVDEVADDTVLFRLAVRGGENALRQSLSLAQMLQPVEDAAVVNPRRNPFRNAGEDRAGGELAGPGADAPEPSGGLLPMGTSGTDSTIAAEPIDITRSQSVADKADLRYRLRL